MSQKPAPRLPKENSIKLSKSSAAKYHKHHPRKSLDISSSITAKMSSNSNNHHEDSLEEDNNVSKKDREEILAHIEGAGFENIRGILQDEDFPIMDELMVGDNDKNNGQNNESPYFHLSIPKPRESLMIQYPQGPSTSKEYIELWYPYKNGTNLEGENTKLYLSLLNQASNSEADVFKLMRVAEDMVSSIKCEKSTRIWRRLTSFMSQLSHMNIPEAACDIARYLHDDPDSIHPYLKCLGRLKPYLSNPLQSFEVLEERVTTLTGLIDSTIKGTRAHQEETIKFANQVSNVSANVSELQETLEQIIIKSKRMDILPATSISPPSAISIPSSITQPQGKRVVMMDLSNEGEYDGLYRLKIKDNKIKTVIPPTSHPEISHLITYPRKIQEIFLNLDQAVLLNRLAKDPTLKKAFTLEPGSIRLSHMKRLTKGINDRPNQWTKIEIL